MISPKHLNILNIILSFVLQSIKQSINQSINPSIHPSINQSVNRSIIQSINQQVNQPTICGLKDTSNEVKKKINTLNNFVNSVAKHCHKKIKTTTIVKFFCSQSMIWFCLCFAYLRPNNISCRVKPLIRWWTSCSGKQPTKHYNIFL